MRKYKGIVSHRTHTEILAMNKYDRNKLYEEVWHEPVSTVAHRYGVSGTALAKACRLLNVPLPSRGYWAEVKSGQPVTRPNLPDLIPDKSITASEDQNKEIYMQSGSPQKRNKKAIRTVKKDIEYEPQGHLKQQIEVFMRHHMVEKEDVIRSTTPLLCVQIVIGRCISWRTLMMLVF